MKKKIVAAFLAVSMLASMFTGCGNKEIATDNTAEVEAPETPADIAEVDETESVAEEDTNTNSDADTKEAGAEQEKIYAPAIEDDIKDEVLAAYQKFMDENDCDECMFFGMDSSELPLLIVSNGMERFIGLYSSGTVSSVETNATETVGGKLIVTMLDMARTNYYEIRDGKIALLCYEGYDEEAQTYKNYDGNGNEIDNIHDILPDTNGIESIYAQRTFAWNLGEQDDGEDIWYDNVEDAYTHRNESLEAEEKIYAPAIDDSIKDEVLTAYQKFMDENGCDRCLLFGMDNSELPLLMAVRDGTKIAALYSDGAVASSVASGMVNVSNPGKISTHHPNEDDIWVTDYYEVLDGKIVFRGTYYTEGEFQFKTYDINGNEVENEDALWEMEYPEDFKSIYEGLTFAFDETWYNNVEEAYEYRNVR